jgi:SMC interacting uncharacterized protein involved in chromosome segregation
VITLAEYELYRAARERDFRFLIERLGADLSPQVRDLLVEILESKPPPHRVSRNSTHERHIEIAERVRALERNGWKQYAAVHQARSDFGCSRQTVMTGLKKLRQKEKAIADVQARTDTMLREILSRTLSPEDVEKVMQERAGQSK